MSSSELRAHVAALNKDFAAFVRESLDSRPHDSWEAGVNDYLNHWKEIKQKFKDVIDSPADVATTSAPAPELKPAAAPFSFLGGGGAAAAADSGAGASQPFQLGSTSFGSAGNPFGGGGGGSGSTGLFNLGGQPPSTSLFASSAFGAGAAGGGFAAAASAQGADEEPERPPSPTKVTESDEKVDVLFKSKAKLLFASKNEETGATEWKDHGLGVLRLQRPSGMPGAKAQLVLRTETLGKVLLNASLYKGMATQIRQAENKKTGEKAKTAEVMMTLFPLREKPPPAQDGEASKSADFDDTPVAQLTLLKVGSLQLANELKEAIANNLPA
ncbi:nuclear pore complex protein Nup50 [Pycnococcus provasolii]